ncbi:MAG: prepilin-type N-terminal cleavage/methylation domain-containing protein [Magnetococcales bacterium]|nr:prepilin-type N-terminal cleavage/methylation domain-containing protein [Magnetococcales bacterium]
MMQRDHHRRTGSGFTLIELMVAIVLTALLVAGLTGLWGMVNEQFFQHMLRQKAVFTLHGHMERLVALYRYTAFLGDGTIHLSGFTGTTNLIHKTGVGENDASNAFVTGLVDYKTSNTAVKKSEFELGQVLFVANANLDVVWLDRDLDVTAKMYWNLDKIVTALSCYSGSACYRLTLWLEFPFRFVEDANPVATMPGITQKISLQTLIGRRK